MKGIAFFALLVFSIGQDCPMQSGTKLGCFFNKYSGAERTAKKVFSEIASNQKDSANPFEHDENSIIFNYNGNKLPLFVDVVDKKFKASFEGKFFEVIRVGDDENYKFTLDNNPTTSQNLWTFHADMKSGYIVLGETYNQPNPPSMENNVNNNDQNQKDSYPSSFKGEKSQPSDQKTADTVGGDSFEGENSNQNKSNFGSLQESNNDSSDHNTGVIFSRHSFSPSENGVSDQNTADNVGGDSSKDEDPLQESNNDSSDQQTAVNIETNYQSQGNDDSNESNQKQMDLANQLIFN